MKLAPALLPILAMCLLLSSCGKEAPQTVQDSAPGATSEEGDSGKSLFSPVNEEHAKNLKERDDEMAEVNARIEAAAQKRDEQMTDEALAKLQEVRLHYLTQYQEHVVKPLQEYEADLKNQYLQNLQETIKVAQAGQAAVLSDQLNQEIQRVQNGETIPFPPAEGDPSNPGMKPLFELRRWYHESEAKITQFKTEGIASLTRNYEQQLDFYMEWAEVMLPPGALQAATKEVQSFDPDSWYKSEPPKLEEKPEETSTEPSSL